MEIQLKTQLSTTFHQWIINFPKKWFEILQEILISKQSIIGVQDPQHFLQLQTIQQNIERFDPSEINIIISINMEEQIAFKKQQLIQQECGIHVKILFCNVHDIYTTILMKLGNEKKVILIGDHTHISKNEKLFWKSVSILPEKQTTWQLQNAIKIIKIELYL